MTLTIENKTHWRKSDIERIVRAAIKEADADPAESRTVYVAYPDRGMSRKNVLTCRFKSSKIDVFMPKRGSRDLHPNVMVALAASRTAATSGVDKDAKILAVANTYFLANYLAFQFAKEALLDYEDEDGKLKAKLGELNKHKHSINCPTWASPESLFVVQYKDPLLDGTYLSKVAKKRTAIKTAETVILTQEKIIAKAQKTLKNAKARKKAAVKSIKDMTERRTGD
jgi:hypothetical protein